MEGGELEIIKKEKYEGELKKIQYQDGSICRYDEKNTISRRRNMKVH